MRKTVDYVKEKIEDLKTRDINTLFDHVKHDQIKDYDKHTKRLDACGLAKPNEERVKDNTFFFSRDARKSWDRENRHKISIRVRAAKITVDENGNEVVEVRNITESLSAIITSTETQETQDQQERALPNMETIAQEKEPEFTLYVSENIRTAGSSKGKGNGNGNREVRKFFRNYKNEIIPREDAKMSELIKYIDNLHGRLFNFDNDYGLFLNSYYRRAEIKIKETISREVDKMLISIFGIADKVIHLSSSNEVISMLENLLDKVKSSKAAVN